MPASPSDIRRATREYEDWLRSQTDVVEVDLRRKHEAMTSSLFTFFRATYYRWAQLWLAEGADLLDGPVVTAIGDLHVENFGTWRDAEGRVAWGVNDFDEASPLTYTNDLVRLATSALLAHRAGLLGLSLKRFCREMLRGYASSLKAGGRAIVLAERNRKLGEGVLRYLVDPKVFWKEKVGKDLRDAPRAPARCRTLLEQALPRGARNIRVRSRVAGAGSLGRPRFVALADWAGGQVAREAKASVASAALWAADAPLPSPRSAHLTSFLQGAVRSADPFLAASHGWVLRRIAPDSDKMRMESLEPSLERRLAMLMGREAANVHLATPGIAAAILRDLRKRKGAWLQRGARHFAKLAERDQEEWRERGRPQ